MRSRPGHTLSTRGGFCLHFLYLEKKRDAFLHCCKQNKTKQNKCLIHCSLCSRLRYFPGWEVEGNPNLAGQLVSTLLPSHSPSQPSGDLGPWRLWGPVTLPQGDGARRTLWTTHPLQGASPASSISKCPPVLFLPSWGRRGSVLAPLNQDCPCPYECPRRCGLIRRIANRGVQVQRGLHSCRASPIRAGDAQELA